MCNVDDTLLYTFGRARAGYGETEPRKTQHATLSTKLRKRDHLFGATMVRMG